MASEADKTELTGRLTTTEMTSEHRKTQTWYKELKLLREVARLSFCCRCTTLAMSALCVLAGQHLQLIGSLISSTAAVQDLDGDFVEDTDEGSGWSSDQVSRFFDAFQEHGQDWVQVNLHSKPHMQCVNQASSGCAGVTTSGQDPPAM